ncbi:hypothetical protein L6V77_06395 [Myxococcota bacterium]|nr:hypothetical protein [Myxococcota bacterium]
MSESSPSVPSWRALLAVALVMAGVIVAFEVGLRRLAPMPRRDLEVDTGVRALAAGNPDVLVLGSSHAGAWLPLIDRLGRDRVAVVTEEGGTFSAFDWVYEHRLAPLVEARDGDAWVRDRLRHVLLITTYWDTCPASHTLWEDALPARAWQWKHYLADVAENGITPRNRNFPFTAMKRLFAESMMIQDRGLVSLRGQLKGADSPDSLSGRKAAHAERRRREIVEEGRTCFDPTEQAKLEGLVNRLQRRGLAVTVVAFPQMSELLTDEARRTTIARYSALLADLRARKGIRTVEHTLTAPLVYDDFEIDCDHLVPAAREKYVDWALENGVGFLRAPPGGGAP